MPAACVNGAIFRSAIVEIHRATSAGFARKAARAWTLIVSKIARQRVSGIELQATAGAVAQFDLRGVVTRAGTGGARVDGTPIREWPPAQRLRCVELVRVIRLVQVRSPD